MTRPGRGAASAGAPRSARARGRARRRCSAAALGMPKTAELASSCAIVRPPARRTSPSPAAPSRPMPVSTTATPSRPRDRPRRCAAARPPTGRCEPGVGAVVEPEPPGRRRARDARPRAPPRSPGRRGPAPASRTGSGTWSSSQRAKPSVKPRVMCWTTRIGIAKPAGSAASTEASAGGPPTDAQIPITEAERGVPRPPAVCRSRPSAPRGWRSTGTRLSSFTRLRKARASVPPGSRKSSLSLQQHLQRAGAERGERLRRAALDAAREHEDRDRVGAHDLLDRLPARHPGQLHVHRHEVRLGIELRQARERRLGGGADPDHLDLRVAGEQPREPGRVGLRVLADEHAARLADGGRRVIARRAVRPSRAGRAGRTCA